MGLFDSLVVSEIQPYPYMSLLAEQSICYILSQAPGFKAKRKVETCPALEDWKQTIRMVCTEMQLPYVGVS